MRLAYDVPLASLTTLRLGGPATRIATIEQEADVPEALALADREGLAAFVLGGGSNVVVGDGGVDALIMHMASRGVALERHGDTMRVTLAAGEPWDAFVGFAVAEGLSGVECLAGIPGLVGATPIQNVGAYGQEVKDTISSVRAFDRDTRQFVDLSPVDCAFGYRASRLKETSRFVVTRVSFDLRVQNASAPLSYAELTRALGIADGEAAPIGRVHETVVGLRRGKGMVLDAGDPDSVSAGSFFMNPVVHDAGLARIVAGAGELVVPRYGVGPGAWKVPAAWLIERSGFSKGFAMGHVHVSTRHALALVNDGSGTTRDLLELARTIRAGVESRFGVVLCAEPVLLGCFL